jgi:hypothetical protein
LIIIFFYIVNKKEIINIKHINILNILGILFPIIIAIVFLLTNALGINGDFCYIKKFSTIHDDDEGNGNIYKLFDDYEIYAIIVYSLRGISFIFSFYFFMKIIIYLRKEKSCKYNLKKLLILIVQLFKLSVIIMYRIPSFFVEEYPDYLPKIYNILSTIDGILMPLAYILSNDIIPCKKGRNETELFGKDFKDDKSHNIPMVIEEDEKYKDRETITAPSAGQSNYTINPLAKNNTNNFEISYSK